MSRSRTPAGAECPSGTAFSADEVRPGTAIGAECPPGTAPDEITIAVQKAEARLERIRSAAEVVRAANSKSGKRMCSLVEAYSCPRLECSETGICHWNVPVGTGRGSP